MPRWISTLLTVAMIPFSAGTLAAGEKIVIAHRGASGYLPEHSPAAKAAAHVMGADYIEQDLVMTRDGRLVVLHDLYLDQVTDVARVFPGRQRGDGRFYVIDFSLQELRRLSLTERFEIRKGRTVPRFAGRFPPRKSAFRISTFEEEIELIEGLNRSTGRTAGLYPEIKAPAFHRREGHDISRAVLEALKAYGYIRRSDPVFLQCFDPRELQRLKRELLPQLAMDLRLVQLIALTSWATTPVYDGDRVMPYDFDWMLAPGAMSGIAAYADGIGPWLGMIVEEGSRRGNLLFSGLVAEAHAAGLVVHPYTFRADRGYVPPYAADFEDLLSIFLFQAQVDGVFTDFPDRALALLQRNKRSRP